MKLLTPRLHTQLNSVSPRIIKGFFNGLPWNIVTKWLESFSAFVSSSEAASFNWESVSLDGYSYLDLSSLLIGSSTQKQYLNPVENLPFDMVNHFLVLNNIERRQYNQKLSSCMAQKGAQLKGIGGRYGLHKICMPSFWWVWFAVIFGGGVLSEGWAPRSACHFAAGWRADHFIFLRPAGKIKNKKRWNTSPDLSCFILTGNPSRLNGSFIKVHVQVGRCWVLSKSGGEPKCWDQY